MTEQLREPRYIRKRVSLSGRQPKVVELPFPVDFIAFTDVSEVDPSKVYVAFNNPFVFIPVSKVIVAELSQPIITTLFLAWDDSEKNKTIEIYVAGAPSLRIGVTTITIGGDYVGFARETTLSSVKDELINLRNALNEPVLDQLILDNATINSAGESDLLNIGSAKHVDVLIYVGTPTGNPNITFHLQVVEPASGKVIRTYDGNQLTGEGADYITVDGLTLGTHVRVAWDGSLDTSNYFSGCFVRIVAKR